MSRTVICWCWWVCAVSLVCGAAAAPLQPGKLPQTGWLDSYAQAMDQAEREGKMMFLLFYERPASPAVRTVEALIGSDPEVRRWISQCVLVKLPVDTVVRIDGQRMRLLDHPSLAEMGGFAGVAMIDLRDPASEHYRYVVSVYPFREGRSLNREKLLTLLQLPAGSLTQRTLIFAVRIHPEHPRSTEGEFHPYLARQTERHSAYQASITLQGHHNWSARFERILGQFAGIGMSSAKEVCAESWPGQDLVGAAIECVHSWRQSSGHWSGVVAPHRLYGYDMKRGSNGVWYATGIFVD